MKYIILVLMLVIVGCSDNSSELREAKHDLRFTTEQLQTCQNQLSVYRDSGSSSSSTTSSEPEEQSGPQYEEVAAYHITTKHGNTVCYERNNAPGGQDSEELACGMTFTDCKDGYIYRCMVDVKYKIVVEQRLVKEE